MFVTNRSVTSPPSVWYHLGWMGVIKLTRSLFFYHILLYMCRDFYRKIYFTWNYSTYASHSFFSACLKWFTSPAYCNLKTVYLSLKRLFIADNTFSYQYIDIIRFFLKYWTKLVDVFWPHLILSIFGLCRWHVICLLHCMWTTQSQILFHHHIFGPHFP